MSKISVSNGTPIPLDEQDARLVCALKNATGLGIVEVQERLSQGKATHLFRAELYLNDHVEMDSKIREILGVLKAYGIASYIMQILHDEGWDNPIDQNLAVISEDMLINMLDEADGEFR